jgi:peptidoglycan/LPS O-acetylase OafA/YrhL
MPTQRIDVIDGLRGIAILMVIYQHGYSIKARDVYTFFTGGYPWILGHAWMGVGIFFILSGFVLAIPFASGRSKLTSREDVRHFFRRRSQRLLPLFIFAAFVSYGISMHVGVPQTRSLILTLTTASMFSKTNFFPLINGPFWSLAVEIWFSVLCPFILAYMFRHNVIRALLAICLFSLIVRVGGTYFPFSNLQTNPVKDSVFGRLDDFAIGIAIAIAFVKGKLPRWGDMHALAGVFLILGTAVLWDFQLQMPKFVSAFFNFGLQAGVALITVAALGKARFTQAILSLWLLRLAGAMCFSLYCWHGLLIGPTMQANPLTLQSIVSFWSALIVISCFSYRFIEFPTKSVKEIFFLKNVRHDSATSNLGEK